MATKRKAKRQTGIRKNKNTKKNGKNMDNDKIITTSHKSFWQNHLAIFSSSWGALRQRKTLLVIGLDILLLLGIISLSIANSLVWSAVAQPLAPVLSAVASLETSGNATNVNRMAILNSYRPDLNGILLKAGLATLVIYLAFIALYALLKTKAWTIVRDERFHGYGKNLALTAGWFLLLLILPVLLLMVNPMASAFVLLVIALLALLFLPLFYAAKEWKHLFRWRLLGNYLFVLLVLLVVWVIVVNILSLTVWLSKGLYTGLLLLWILLWTAWGRYYIQGFVTEYAP